MTEIMPYAPPGGAEIDYTWNLANKLAKTEFVPSNLRNRPEAILAVFLTGRELGIGPMQSLRDIYPVNGRPALMASLMVARVRGLGHRVRTITSSDQQATVQVHRKGEAEPELPVTFTIEDAKRADLLRKDVWRQYPKAMLWNRAAAAACRRDCPEALGGAVYTPEELGDGDGSTTATWGAPEPAEYTTDPGMAQPPRSQPGSVPTSPPPPTTPTTAASAAQAAGTPNASAEGQDGNDAAQAGRSEPPKVEATTSPPATSPAGGDGNPGGGRRGGRASPGRTKAPADEPPAGSDQAALDGPEPPGWD